MGRRLGSFIGGACVFLALFGSGCSDSADSHATHGADAVYTALRQLGLRVEVVFDRSAGDVPENSVVGLLDLHTPLGHVTALLADSNPDGAVGSAITAWVYESKEEADAMGGDGRLRLQQGNVVLQVSQEHEAAARAALQDLG